MVEAYNFLASWQLFPERGTYSFGSRPKAGIYKIELGGTGNDLVISMNWVTLEDQAFSSSYTAELKQIKNEIDINNASDVVWLTFIDATNFEIQFCKNGILSLSVVHEITPKGYLKVTQKRFSEHEEPLINTEIYHKQLSVLPYSASVAGAIIKPNEEGVIRHQALSAMEEQTNMQLTQIRQQIELLAIQAKEIQKRKELSMLIYEAKLSFAPVIGKVYYLYEKDGGAYLVSMIGPTEWGRKTPYKSFISAIQLLADHTWKEV
jgi:hypothetical protein